MLFATAASMRGTIHEHIMGPPQTPQARHEDDHRRFTMLKPHSSHMCATAWTSSSERAHEASCLTGTAFLKHVKQD